MNRASIPCPRSRGREDADAARCKIVEAQSCTLKQLSKRFIGAQSHRNRVRSLGTHDLRDIEELQTSLAGERCKRLCEGLGGNVGGESSGFKVLSYCCRGVKERSGYADRECPKHCRRHCNDVR